MKFNHFWPPVRNPWLPL